GLSKYFFTDGGLQAESAGLTLAPEEGYGTLGTLGIVFLALRAFSSGCTALTGVEAIANGVPAFRAPKARNAATTLTVMAVLAGSMFIGLTTLAVLANVRYSEDPVKQFVGFPADGVQRTVIAQVGSAVFGDNSFGFYFLTAATAGVLILAANTAYNAFPSLSSLLAQYRYLPRQLHNRGDRLVYSNGVLGLAVASGLLIYVFDASVTRLIQLYILGVFTSFTFGQVGMVVHWNRALRASPPAEGRRSMRRSRAINAFGAGLTALVLVLVTTTKFTQGAYLVVLAMPVLYLLMSRIKRHYDRVAVELEPDDEPVPLPSRNHAIVLVSKVHAPTLRALAYARGTRPHDLTALTVSVDAEESKALQEAWDRRDLPVPLTIIVSPFRDITRPVLDYVRAVRLQSPRDVVTVFIPEYVVGHWWEQLLHNQSALRLKGRLLFQPGVMVTSVAYQLRSADRLSDDDAGSAPGDVRRPVSDL
ncbi:MAG: APC family permease, partial [Frankiales bacterium]|nr:APC family permease [Frankiales bacterium]